jgi:hypothetical protein
MANPEKDKLFITEIIADLHENGFSPNGKAAEMLYDWSHELTERIQAENLAGRITER